MNLVTTLHVSFVSCSLSNNSPGYQFFLGISEAPRSTHLPRTGNNFSSVTILSPPLVAKLYLMQEDLELILKTTHQSPVKLCQSRLAMGTN